MWRSEVAGSNTGIRGALKREESKYLEAVRAHKSYDTLKAIRKDIRDLKQELQALYTTRDEA